MPSPFNPFGAYIKDLWIELPQYKFQHGTIDNQNDPKWVERKAIEDKLLSYLENGCDTGAYLITGYRGMGKTSFVKKVIKAYKSKSTFSIKDITVSFGQKDIKELDILRQILKGIKDQLLDTRILWLHTRVFTSKSLPFWVAITFIVLLISNFYNLTTGLQTAKDAFEIFGAILIVSLVFAYLLLEVLILLFKAIFFRVRIYDELKDLYDRSRSQITKEAGADINGERFPLGFVDKMIKKFPLANPKEVENDIIELLIKINNAPTWRGFFFWTIPFLICIPAIYFTYHILPSNSLWQGLKMQSKYIFTFLITILPIALSFLIAFLFSALYFKKYEYIYSLFTKRKFIFIFDEIDKIDPSPDREYYHEEMEDFEKNTHSSDIYDYRERRRVVINILANLKYLITTAQAKFIFIAGREMFDAALADIADRQSSVSSIFHQVINVDSFLKGSDIQMPALTKGSGGLSTLIEDYLENILFPSDPFGIKSDKVFLKRYYDQLSKNNVDINVRFKIIYALQNLIVYLTYRSNGSPKKLVRLIEDMIKRKIELNSKYLIEDDKNIIVYAHVKADKQYRYFLHFNLPTQYKIGFISYIFRPFVTSQGNYFKAYSDKILVSTPYLFDHIIKFHPFAFSLQNLELVPEVLSETRSPELRNFLENLVTYLGLSHIRETEIGLFEYKFLNETVHEIVYLSKIFEDESAAFNFTLDETFHVKLHIRNKIKELRSIYKNFINSNNVDLINSISFLNDLLGDAHFFDQEYDEAIIAYYDSLQVLEQKLVNVEPSNGSLKLEHFVRYVRLKLKIGLTHEKMKSYEIATAIYSETSSYASSFVMRSKDNGLKSVSSRKDALQILIQPYLAELHLQEKLSVEGTSSDKIATSLHSFEKLFCEISTLEPNFIIQSNFYSNLGSLLFYKNHKMNQFQNADIYQKELYTLISECDKDFDTFFPEAIKDNFGNEYRDYRMSKTAFGLFKTSLRSLLSYTYPIKQIVQLPLIELLCRAEDLLAYHAKSEDVGTNSRYTANEFKHDKTFLKNIALSLSKLGDCLFSGLNSMEIDLTSHMKDGQKESNRILHTNIFKDKKAPKNNGDTDNTYWSFHSFKEVNICATNESIFQLIMCIYFWSAHFFLRAGKNNGYSLMFRKLFHIMHLIGSSKTTLIFLSQFEKYFLKEILKVTTWNSNGSDRYQIFSYKYIFDIEEAWHPLDKSKFDYMNASTSPEVKEAIIIYSLLKLKAIRYGIENINNREYKVKQIEGSIEKTGNVNAMILEKRKFLDDRANISALVSPYNTISSQYSRYLELALQVKINESLMHDNQELLNLFRIWSKNLWKKYKRLYNEELKGTVEDQIREISEKILERLIMLDPDYNSSVSERINISENLKIVNLLMGAGDIILSSIYCLREIIRIYNDMGINPFMNHSSLGYYHKNLGDWIRYYELIKYINKNFELSLDNNKGICLDTELKAESLLGNDFVNTMDSIAQYQFALQNYSKARQFHNEGTPYKNQILNMYYLEDDFNDGIYHFGLAIERQRLNSGKLRKRIEKIEDEVKDSQLYNYLSYVNNQSLK